MPLVVPTVTNSEGQYGISDPVTIEGPSPEDLEASDTVVKLLQSHNLFETEAGKQKRESILESLNRLLQQFVRKQAAKCPGIGEEKSRSISGKLLTFGSYRLGIVAPDSDIDVLCLCPNFITREHFFSDFFQSLTRIKLITKLIAVPDAYTPVIKMIYDGIDIDVLFSNLCCNNVAPDVNILDDGILRNMNEEAARSINGCRVASLILGAVPNRLNFRVTLRYIKLWATRRVLYTTDLGFLGGVAWAILTARVCQLYPNYVSSQLIEKFFKVYSLWNWKIPVMLYKIKPVPNTPGFMSFKVWDPRNNLHDRQHLLPVITPAFPAMNSTHNVTLTTKRILTDEFKRARDILKTPNVPRELLWEQVLDKEDIFISHNHFLMIEVLSSEEALHGKWEGWVGSRLRFLIKKLEVVPNALIRPWPGFFKYKDDEWEFASSAFLGLKYVATDKTCTTLDLRGSIASFKQIVNGWGEMESFKDQVKVNVRYLRSSQLPSYVLPNTPRKRLLE